MRGASIECAYFAPLGSRSFGAGRPEYGQRIDSKPAYMQALQRSGLDLPDDREPGEGWTSPASSPRCLASTI